jgi:hypothetical protein
LYRLFQWWHRIVYWASDGRRLLANAVRAPRSLVSGRKASLLVLAALPLLLGLALLPVPPGSSWPRLAERAAWQWSLLQDTPESYEWFYRDWASKAGQPVVAERIEDATWSRAVRANTYDDYVAYISAYAPNGRHVVAAFNAADDLLWAQVDSIGTRASYSTYLDKFARGRHTQEAQDNLEEITWRQIAASLTVAGLTDFISEFPAGRHVAEAQHALERLQQRMADAAPPADPSSPPTSPFGAAAAAGTVTASIGGRADGLPRGANVSGAPVPLPRPRPHVLDTADGDVPLPRPRPKPVSASAPQQTSPNPLGWLQGLFQPHH